MKFKTTLKRTVAATVLAGLATIGLASAAVAADDPTQITGSTGTIEVTKYFQEADGTTADGSTAPTTTPASPVVQGVKYKLTKVNKWDNVTFDAAALKKNDTWAKINELATQFKAKNVSPAIASGDEAVIQAKSSDTPATGEDGKIKWEGLALGVYILQEVSVDGAKVIGDTKGETLTLDDTKYLVTVPMTNPTGNGWNYDVKVYPKNKKGGSYKPSKEVTGKAAKIGDLITYTLTAPVPNNGKDYTMFQLMDQTTAGLEFSKILSAKLKNNTTENALTENTDYTKDGPDSNRVLKIDIKQDAVDGKGLKLLNANKGDKTNLVFEVQYKVTGNGTVANRLASRPSSDFSECFDTGTSTNFPDDPKNCKTGDTPPPTITTDVVTDFGGFQITKVDGSATDTKLKDAKFKVFYCKESTTTAGKYEYQKLNATNDGMEALGADDTPTPIEAVNGAEGTTTASEFTTDTNGKIVVSGLVVPTDNNIGYCVKETVAPKGFQIIQDLIPVKVVKKDAAGKNTLYGNQDVKNYKGVNLPLTGSQALALTMIAGVLLTAGATFVLIRRRRVQG